MVGLKGENLSVSFVMLTLKETGKCWWLKREMKNYVKLNHPNLPSVKSFNWDSLDLGWDWAKCYEHIYHWLDIFWVNEWVGLTSQLIPYPNFLVPQPK